MSPVLKFIRVLAICSTLTSGMVAQVGCDPAGSSPYAKGRQRAFVVNLDREDNGAAEAATDRGASPPGARPRQLAFKVTGTARKPGDDDRTKARIAATQAAVLDAFGKALIEARQSRGQTTSDFVARLGSRLTVVHESTGGSQELRVTLNYNGVDNTLVVRDGELRHPPVDFRLIRRLFDETNGEFSLLATDESSSDQISTATVACYLPPGFAPGVPANIARIDTNEP